MAIVICGTDGKGILEERSYGQTNSYLIELTSTLTIHSDKNLISFLNFFSISIEIAVFKLYRSFVLLYCLFKLS